MLMMTKELKYELEINSWREGILEWRQEWSLGMKEWKPNDG